MDRKKFMAKCVWRVRPDGEIFYGWYDADNGCIAGAENILKFDPVGVPSEVICSETHGQSWQELADILLASDTMLFCAHAKYNSTLRYYHGQRCVKLIASEALLNMGYEYITILKGQLLRTPSVLKLRAVGIVVSSLSTPNTPMRYLPKLYAELEDSIIYVYTRYGRKQLDDESVKDVDEIMCRVMLRSAINSKAYGVISLTESTKLLYADEAENEVRLE